MNRGKFTMIENPVPWPNGARCAAAFTWDMDADSILHLAHPDDADTRVSAMTDLRYGPEIAVPLRIAGPYCHARQRSRRDMRNLSRRWLMPVPLTKAI